MFSCSLVIEIVLLSLPSVDLLHVEHNHSAHIFWSMVSRALQNRENFPTLLSLKIKLRKNYPDFLILTMLDLYCDLFFFASYMFVRVLWVDWKGQYDSFWFWMWDLRWSAKGSTHGYLYSRFEGQIFVLLSWSEKRDLL